MGALTETRRARLRAGSGALLAALVMVACQDLDVTNPNAPDRDRALSTPQDVENLIAGTFAVYWSSMHGNTAASTQEAAFFTAAGNEYTSTSAVWAVYQFASSRPPQPLLNLSTAESATDPVAPLRSWQNFHEVVSSANEGLAVINNGMVIRTPEETIRAQAFAKFMQGLAWGQLGLLFDRATLLDENDDLEEGGIALVKERIRPYPEVIAKAIESLDDAIELAQSTSFTLPAEWTGAADPITSAELVRIANSFAAKFLVYSARNPQEREQVDWNEVLRRTEAGVTRDFGPSLTPTGFMSALWLYLQRNTAFHILNGRAHYDVVGPADQSGAWQTFLATPQAQRNRFDIVTPDRRVTGPTPTSSGSIFRWLEDNNGFTASRGTYLFSSYQWYRENGNSTDGEVPLMSVVENDLLRAEALIRTGSPEAAAQLINKTRTAPQVVGGVTYPGLPPVTPAGVPTDENGYCVPRTESGACGDLMDALVYERRIELIGVDAFRSWVDNRGLGRLAEGMWVHLPIPHLELEVLEQPNYTYGGVGGNCAAGSSCVIPEIM